MTGRPIANKARRVDVMVIHTPYTYDVLGKGRSVVEGYRVGIVLRITRDGVAKTVDVGREFIDPREHRCAIRMCQSPWLVSGDQVDVNSLIDWLIGDENAQPQPTIDAAREVVRRFLRNNPPASVPPGAEASC